MAVILVQIHNIYPFLYLVSYSCIFHRSEIFQLLQSNRISWSIFVFIPLPTLLSSSFAFPSFTISHVSSSLTSFMAFFIFFTHVVGFSFDTPRTFLFLHYFD